MAIAADAFLTNTLLETLAGFGLSLAIGIPSAFLIVYSRIFDRVLYPILIASQAVPKVALAPILLVALGYSILPKVIVAFLIAFFPVVVNTVTGLASVDRETLNLMHSMGASKLDVFVKVRFPHAVPTCLRFGGNSACGGRRRRRRICRQPLRARLLACFSRLEISTHRWCSPRRLLTLIGILLSTRSVSRIAFARFNRTARIAQGVEPAGAFGM